MSLPTSSLIESGADGDIVFDDVTFKYAEGEDSTILTGLSARFGRKRISLVTGKSGSGKSTLLSLAAGIYPIHAGTVSHGKILVAGIDPTTLPPVERVALVGIVFQNPSLQFCMDTVENELFFCLGNACVPRERMPAAVQEALGFCDIEHLRHRTLRTLSGGEKQMVALASIVALKPAWLLLDEPFANVDEEWARVLAGKVEALHRSGMGVLVVDHRIDHWRGIVDSIWLLDKGRELTKVAGTMKAGEREFKRPAHHVSDRAKSGTDPIRLELRDLTVRRGDRFILDRVSVAFRAGRVYALTGASGSGKSTLFDALLGATRYSGQVLLEGRPLHRRGRAPAGAIGFVTQNPHDQFVADTVYDEVATSIRQGHAPHTDLDKAVKDVLGPIGLWAYRQLSPYSLSQGQQRRLGVAALLAYDCNVLVCDEPTYAQDDDSASKIMGALETLVRKRGITLIFSTHDLALARRYGDVFLHLQEGCLREVD